MIQGNVPSMCSSPVLGSKFFLRDAKGKLVEGSEFEEEKDGSNSGELVIAPPAIGLSTTLLNKDHFSVYFEGMTCGPDGGLLRRHGDEVEFVRSSLHFPKEKRESTPPYFRVLGRSDDTMNIGGEEN